MSPLPKPFPMLGRRLEDKIRYVCVVAMAARDDDAWLFLSELRVLLCQHAAKIRAAAAAKMSGKTIFVERRSERDMPIPELTESIGPSHAAECNGPCSRAR